MSKKLASAVLQYGPFDFPIDLYGFVDAERGEVYEYGIISATLPDGVSAEQVKQYRTALHQIANGPHAFGVKQLYFESEAPDLASDAATAAEV